MRNDSEIGTLCVCFCVRIARILKSGMSPKACHFTRLTCTSSHTSDSAKSQTEHNDRVEQIPKCDRGIFRVPFNCKCAANHTYEQIVDVDTYLKHLIVCAIYLVVRYLYRDISYIFYSGNITYKSIRVWLAQLLSLESICICNPMCVTSI